MHLEKSFIEVSEMFSVNFLNVKYKTPYYSTFLFYSCFRFALGKSTFFPVTD